MALDLALLERVGRSGHHAFRSYGWEGEVLTFGYRQCWLDVLATRPAGMDAGQCQRRPSGGGMVDHRHDWTYALVLAADSPWHRMPARDSYRFVHGLWCDVFAALGLDAHLAPCPGKANCGGPRNGVLAENNVEACFESPSADDVLNAAGRKIAGAAQKRTRDGLLIQGSIDAAALPPDWDRDACMRRFCQDLARALDVPLAPVPDPGILDTPRLRQQADMLRSDGWNRKR